MMNRLSQLCSSSRADATCTHRTPVGQFPSRRLQTKDLRTRAERSVKIRHFRGASRLVRRRMYDSGVRPEAAILGGFFGTLSRSPTLGSLYLPRIRPIAALQFTALSRYHHPHARRTV